MVKSSALVCVAFIGSLASAEAETPLEKARLGRVAWSAFTCSGFARLNLETGKAEQRRLLEVGFRAGREFLEAFRKNQIPDETVLKEVPYDLLLLLDGGPTNFVLGPTNDFLLGRAFQEAEHVATAEILREANPSGKLPPLDPPDIVLKTAKRKYDAANCMLLK